LEHVGYNRSWNSRRVDQIHLSFLLFSFENGQILERRTVLNRSGLDAEDASMMRTVHLVIEDHGVDQRTILVWVVEGLSMRAGP
jgi:hypothetical protein